MNDGIILDDDNFLLYAMHNYDNSQCKGLSEFEEDLNRFKYLKRLFIRYSQSGDLKERLILNHIIVLYNVFGPTAATKLLFFKIEPEFWPVLKPFLVFLSYLPNVIIADKQILESNIKMDPKVVEVLRGI